MRSIGPAVTREQSPAFLHNSNGRLDFPGPTQEAFLGLNFRMNELTGAVALAQLRQLDAIVATLRRKKAAFKSRIAGLPGVGFRRLPDAEGECATLCTVIFDDAGRAARVAERLGTMTVDRSGWHVYANMEHVNRWLAEHGRPS